MKELRRALLPLIVGWLAAVAFWIAAGPEEKPTTSASVAIVLGAAVEGSEPSPVLRERIAHAIDLYREGRVQHLLFTGGKGEGDQLAESEVARDMAIAGGVPAEAILVETFSITTM